MNDRRIAEWVLSWFEGTITPEERRKAEEWKAASEENRQFFAESLRVLEGIKHLGKMKKFDAQKALRQVNARIKNKGPSRILRIFQKVAAVLLAPLIITTLYFALKKPQPPEKSTAWHTLETAAGMRSEFFLPDSTKVYLNSKTSLSYPVTFSKHVRKVKLAGEAYFEVAENKDAPFIVKTGKINIKATGTEFMATNYPREELVEVALIEGGIKLFQGDCRTTYKEIIRLKPGQKAFWKEGKKKLLVNPVDTEKYTAWKNGILLFRDDPMPEVVRRLNRWFNVDIRLTAPELKNYVYTATFEDESLKQVLDLLKISAPIDYTIKKRERKTNKTFSKMEIEIKQK